MDMARGTRITPKHEPRSVSAVNPLKLNRRRWIIIFFIQIHTAHDDRALFHVRRSARAADVYGILMK